MEETFHLFMDPRYGIKASQVRSGQNPALGLAFLFAQLCHSGRVHLPFVAQLFVCKRSSQALCDSCSMRSPPVFACKDAMPVTAALCSPPVPCRTCPAFAACFCGPMLLLFHAIFYCPAGTSAHSRDTGVCNGIHLAAHTSGECMDVNAAQCAPTVAASLLALDHHLLSMLGSCKFVLHCLKIWPRPCAHIFVL